jgi:hypothetical protein
VGFLQYGTCSTTTPRSPFIRDRFLEKWDPFSAEHLVVEEDAVVLVEQVLVVPVEVLARAVLPAQAAAIRALLPIRRQILQARRGAVAPILQQAIRTPEVWLNRQNESNQNRSPRRR